MKKPLMKLPILLGIACIVVAGFAVYSNGYKHCYPLDDGHLLVDNPSVRSLKFIPSYFTDGRTLTVLPANADYRPVLQVTYALNYAISKYDTWSWHLVQILLHLVCAISLFFLCRRIIKDFHPGAGEPESWAVPLVAALLFTVHPTASGVINYLSARSSLLTAAFLLPSFVLYMRPLYHGDRPKIPAAPAILYALALFTKIEAVGALAVYFLYECVQLARRHAFKEEPAGATKGGFFRDITAALNLSTLRKLWLFGAVTVVYAALYLNAMHGYSQAARHSADVTGFIYFWTQLTAWWHYVLNWFAPVRLIADDLGYPVFRSLFAPEVLLAAAGWILAAGLISLVYPRYPYIPFLAVSALALISPTSSIAPLAEMVNEHRPYLPMALLSTAWIIPAGLLAFRAGRRWRFAAAAAVCGFAVLAASFFCLTFQRNKVFAEEAAYYRDIIAKAPSSRAYVNYGLTFMSRGDYKTALKYFTMALERAPNWHIVHINLAIAYQAIGNTDLARGHFDRAVECERYSAYGLLYRAEFELGRKEYRAALADCEKALPLTREYFRIYKAMARSLAGLGDWENSIAYVKKCRDLDSAAAEIEIVEISRPFWDNPAAYAAGISFYREIDKLYPHRWWVMSNIGDLALKTGQTDLSRASFEESKRLQNQSVSQTKERTH